MVECGLEACLVDRRCNVEQRPSGRRHGGPRTRLDVGGDEITAAMHGGAVGLRVSADGNGDLDRPAAHPLESPQRGRRQV
jgi:hypothetical protein